MFLEFSCSRFLNFGLVARIDRLNIMFLKIIFSLNLESSNGVGYYLSSIFILEILKPVGNYWINLCILLNGAQSLLHTVSYILYCSPGPQKMGLRYIFKWSWTIKLTSILLTIPSCSFYHLAKRAEEMFEGYNLRV